MTLFDMKKIRESLSKSAGGIKKSFSAAAEKLPDAAKSINLTDSMKDMAEKSQTMMDTLKAKSDELAVSRKETADEAKIAIDSALADQKHSEALFSVRDALRIMYCLMLIDGTVIAEEESKFSEIGKAYDQDFDIYKKQLIDECVSVAQTETAQGVEFVSIESEDSEEYYEQLHNYVGNLIQKENFYRTEGIRAKELIWNLLAIAYSEDEYSETEKQLIRFVAEQSGVHHSTLLEMEHELTSLIEIDKEEEALKSGSPSAEVEEKLTLLAQRKNTIMKGIDTLISD